MSIDTHLNTCNHMQLHLQNYLCNLKMNPTAKRCRYTISVILIHEY